MASCIEREINAFLWLSLISVTSYLLGRLGKVFELWRKARPIPGPPCPSFYGHGRLISTSSLTDILHKMHKKYGGVVKLWLGPTQLLVSIEDMDLIREVLLKAEDKLPLTGRAFRLAFGKSSLFISSFDKAHLIQEVPMTIMSSLRSFLYKHSCKKGNDAVPETWMPSKLQQAVYPLLDSVKSFLYDVKHQRNSLELKLGGALLERASLIPERILGCVIENAQSAMGNRAVDSKTISLRLAYTILGATIFGDVFLAWPKAPVYEELLMKISKDACFWASYGITPFWKRGFWRYQDSCAKLKCLTQELIKECRQKCKPVFLWEIDGHDNTEYDPCGEIISLMFHGSLTMAALIANMLTRLVTHVDIQDKIYLEIVMAQKVGRRPDEQNNNMVPNLVAAVYESARLLPAGPLLQRCSLRHDLKLKDGTVIPASAIIVVPVQLVQMDSSNWGSDALKFNPCRFLSSTDGKCISDQKETLTGHTSSVLKEPNEFKAFLPFGYGTRACIGQKLAVLGISSLFAALIEHYEVRPQPGSEINPKPKMNNCVLQLLPSPQIIFIKRSD